MKEDYYIPLEIPDFEDIKVSKEEIIQCKNLFEELATVMRDRCGIFDIHIAYYTTCKLKDLILESMKLNLDMIVEEKKRRDKIND